jgi:pilus assembly protein CpaB
MARGRGSDVRQLVMFFGLIVVAVGAGGVLIMQVFSGYDRQIAVANRPTPKTMLVIAARDLYQGVKVTEADVSLIEIPVSFAPNGSFDSIDSIVGRIPRERVLANEFVREERLSNPEEGVGLNALVPQGQRAISINVKGGDAVSGFINPDNIVDILVTITGDDEDAVSETHTVLQAVPVLAVDARLKGDEVGKTSSKTANRMRPSVTFAVTPDQAEQVAHAEKQGDINLALRNDLDRRLKHLEGVNSDDVMGVEQSADPVSAAPVVFHPKATVVKKVEVKVVAEPKATLQIFKGTQSTEVEYD